MSAELNDFQRCRLHTGPEPGPLERCIRPGRPLMYWNEGEKVVEYSCLCEEHEQLVYYCEDCGHAKHYGACPEPLE